MRYKTAVICTSTEAAAIAGAHLLICEALKYETGAEIPVLPVGGEADTEITVETDTSLPTDGYAVTCRGTASGIAVRIAYNGKYAMLCAVDRFVKTYIGKDGLSVPAGTDIRGRMTEEEAVVTTSIPCLRDPYIVVCGGTLYAHGTGWRCRKNETGDLATGWEEPTDCVEVPADAVDCHWAPEVHLYRGMYYMFTTYLSAKRGKRGCTVLRAESPAGPFAEISGGHITPDEWDCIDGTLYVDGAGQPWIVFVHEWVSAPGNIGSFAAMRLTDDLSRTVGEPVEMFRATDPSWARAGVTDGCWMYTTREGDLLMLWSNWDPHGYSVGLARSSDGTLTGTWTQSDRLLFSRTAYGAWDGGHGMLFTAPTGQMYLSLHSPNDPVPSRRETPVFIPVREDFGTLCPDLWKA